MQASHIWFGIASHTLKNFRHGCLGGVDHHGAFVGFAPPAVHTEGLGELAQMGIHGASGGFTSHPWHSTWGKSV